MDLADLLKPRALFRARERDYRLEDLRKDLLLAWAVDTEEALFHLPLEDRGIRLTFLGLPYVVFRGGGLGGPLPGADLLAGPGTLSSLPPPQRGQGPQHKAAQEEDHQGEAFPVPQRG
jgi:hypothetical protein